MKRALGFSILLIMAGLLTACTTTGTPSVDDIVARMQAAQQQPMHAVIDMTITWSEGELAGAPAVMGIEQWTKGPDKWRAVYRRGPVQMIGTTIVFNGRQMWTYNPNTNTYTEITLPEGQKLPSSEDMAAQMRTTVTRMLETMEFTSLGTEEVAGRRAHKLHALPKPGQATESFLGTPGEATLWVDAETWQTLKMEIDREGGEHMSWVVREIEYDPNLPDDLFTFVPPEGARRAEAPQMRTMTLEEARQAVDFPVLAPTEVPAGYELQGVQVMDAQRVPGGESHGPAVIVMYRSGSDMLSIQQSPASPGGQPPPGEAVTVRGHEGVVRETGFGMRMLIWKENGVLISMFGKLSKEDMLAVAESLE